jgi:hypothetical protein
VNARRYLIRLSAKGIENWLKETPLIDDLAKVFDLAKPEQSVYEVSDGEEEWLAIAAHALTNPKQGPDATSILRIRWDDLERAEITVDSEQPGTTGVVCFDYRHRNLCATRPKLLTLVGHLAGECARGHDRVRRVIKDHVMRSLRRICAYEDRHCPLHVKRIARWALKEEGPPTFERTRVQQELLTVEFADEVLQPRAAGKQGWDPTSNWYGALHEQREAYANHYLPALARRLGPALTSVGSLPGSSA